MEILSQRDIRWKNKTINGTTSTIGDYGCTLTCLAMLADTTPDIVEGKLEFSVDRIIWTSINKTDLPIRFPDMGRVYSYDNDKVKEAIEKNGGCLVEVDFDGITSTPNDRHWVLFVGKGKAYDPWTGTEILTTKYPILKGFCIINVNKDETMTDEQKKVLEKVQAYQKEANHSNLEGAVDALIGNITSLKNATESIETLTNSIKTLEAQLEAVNAKVAELEAKFVENQKELAKQQKTLLTANDKISEQDKTISNITEEKNTWQTRYNNKNTEFNDLKTKYDELEAKYNSIDVSGYKPKFNLLDFIKSLFKK